jgi:hypothetical protein
VANSGYTMPNDTCVNSLICVFVYTERSDALSLSKCRSVNLENALVTLNEFTTKRLHDSTNKQKKVWDFFLYVSITLYDDK